MAAEAFNFRGIAGNRLGGNTRRGFGEAVSVIATDPARVVAPGSAVCTSHTAGIKSDGAVNRLVHGEQVITMITSLAGIGVPVSIHRVIGVA